MDSGFNIDDWIDVCLEFDKANSELLIKILAKKSVCITEVQGFKSDLEVFGMSIPEGFRHMEFGEGVKIPEEMKNEIYHMNRLNFRWGCNYSLKSGCSTLIRIPTSGIGKENLAITLAYEYPKFGGLLKGRNGLYARISKKLTNPN